MCRHLGYIGPAVPISTLVLDPEHSLLRQSWAPTDMRHGGTINADGFGVGWFAEEPDPKPEGRIGPLDAGSGRADHAETNVVRPTGDSLAVPTSPAVPARPAVVYRR